MAYPHLLDSVLDFCMVRHDAMEDDGQARRMDVRMRGMAWMDTCVMDSEA